MVSIEWKHIFTQVVEFYIVRFKRGNLWFCLCELIVVNFDGLGLKEVFFFYI
jgi:hypothetical protein